ncbi:hypothetical protein J6590_030322 [Homalodisca vitripennis]|nr:hypothetical protein J6590_030322 [Homalodisca vitripennis]
MPTNVSSWILTEEDLYPQTNPSRISCYSQTIAASPSVYEELNGWLHWAADMPTAVDVQPPTATCRRPNSDAHDQLHVYILGIFFLASF